jgi:AcrR family transcriptional regulator
MTRKASSSPPKGRQAQKRATQGRILEIARIHFERDGFEGANVRAIAAEAGVAAGTVLLHFTDKLGLLHAALFDDLEATIQRCIATTRRGTLLTRLTAVARPFYAYYAARPKLSKILLRESLLAESPWRERFTEQLVRVNAHLIGIVEEAKASGEIASSTHAPLLGAAFSSFYYFALIGWVQGALDDPLPLFKKLMAQHLAGAGKDAS